MSYTNHLSSAASTTAVIAASSSCTSVEEQDFEVDSVTTDLFEAIEPSSMTFRLQLVTQCYYIQKNISLAISYCPARSQLIQIQFKHLS